MAVLIKTMSISLTAYTPNEIDKTDTIHISCISEKNLQALLILLSEIKVENEAQIARVKTLNIKD